MPSFNTFSIPNSLPMDIVFDMLPLFIKFTSISIVRFCRSQKLSDKNSLYFQRSYD